MPLITLVSKKRIQSVSRTCFGGVFGSKMPEIVDQNVRFRRALEKLLDASAVARSAAMVPILAFGTSAVSFSCAFFTDASLRPLIDDIRAGGGQPFRDSKADAESGAEPTGC